MLISLGFFVVYVYNWFIERHRAMQYLRLVHEHLSRASVVLQRVRVPQLASPSHVPEASAALRSGSRILLKDNSLQIDIVEPKIILSLSGWKSCNSSSPSSAQQAVNFDPTATYFLCDLTAASSTAIKSDSSPLPGLLLDSVATQFAYKPKPDDPPLLTIMCPSCDLDRLLQAFVDVTLTTRDGHVVASLTSVELDSQTFEVSNLTVNSVDRKSCSSSASRVADLTSLQVTERCEKVCSKPPNVLVYCGKKDSTRLYDAVKNVVSQCINTNRYTVYHLKHEQVLTTPWSDNTALLVVASDKVYDGVDRCFLEYFLRGGSLVSFGSGLDSLILHRVPRSPADAAAAAAGLGILTLRCGGQDNVAVICGRHCYEEVDGTPTTVVTDSNVKCQCIGRDSKTGQCVVVEAVNQSNTAVAVLSQVYLDKDPVEMAISNDVFTLLKQSNAARFEILTDLFSRLGVDCDKPVSPPLTPVYLLTHTQTTKSLFLESVLPRLRDNRLVSKDLTLNFVTTTDGHITSTDITTGNTPLITTVDGSTSASFCRFSSPAYWQHLDTKVLGNTVLYADVISTTMNLFEGLMFSCPSNVGLIGIARQQVAGQGRGGNTWLSPVGCAMFSLHVRVPIASRLGEHVTCLQHLMALAVVLAVRSKPGCESVDVRIKWPNDIYFGRAIKLGGIIVKSSVMHDVIHANIGCGVNVTNKDPTTCINDLVSQLSSRSSSDSRSPTQTEQLLFSVEELIARSVTQLERLIALFQSQGHQAFLNLYYQYWLHGGSEVQLGVDGTTRGTIVGLDDFGFLQVKLSNNDIVSVQPDGNSFDMMKNLIVPKTR